MYRLAYSHGYVYQLIHLVCLTLWIDFSQQPLVVLRKKSASVKCLLRSVKIRSILSTSQSLKYVEGMMIGVRSLVANLACRLTRCCEPLLPFQHPSESILSSKRVLFARHKVKAFSWHQWMLVRRQCDYFYPRHSMRQFTYWITA